MDKWKIVLMRELQKEYYGEKKDPWKDMKYLGWRIVLVGLLVAVVLSIWGW